MVVVGSDTSLLGQLGVVSCPVHLTLTCSPSRFSLSLTLYVRSSVLTSFFLLGFLAHRTFRFILSLLLLRRIRSRFAPFLVCVHRHAAFVAGQLIPYHKYPCTSSLVYRYAARAAFFFPLSLLPPRFFNLKRGLWPADRVSRDYGVRRLSTHLNNRRSHPLD